MACRALHTSAPRLKLSAAGIRYQTIEKLRQRALKRLNESIVPTDLSATLEAHRESNRASVIQHVPNEQHDSEIVRPSFLEQRAPIKSIRSRPMRDAPAKKKKKKEETENQQSAKALFAQTMAKMDPKKNDNHAKAEQLIRLVPIETPLRTAKETDTYNLLKHNERLQFLRTHEHPLADTPTYDAGDRVGFFQVIRRCSSIIRAEQKKSLKAGKVDIAMRDLLEYTGTDKLLESGISGFLYPEPWARFEGKGSCTPEELLDEEIKSFAEWMEPSAAEEAGRTKVSDMVVELVQQAAPELQAEKFGSQTTGLTMPNSDIDIRVRQPNYQNPPPDVDMNDKANRIAYFESLAARRAESALVELRKIQSGLATHPDFDDIEIKNAHFPLVAATHVPSGLTIQIVAAKPTDKSREVVQRYLAEIPQLRTMYRLVKTTLDLRGLSDPWNGGVGSYTLFIMCAAALKWKQTNRLGDDLRHILRFWANFKTYYEGMSIEPLEKWLKERFTTPEEVERRKTDPVFFGRLRVRQPNTYKPYLLALQDPANPYNDLGRTGLAFKDLQRTFHVIYSELYKSMKTPPEDLENKPLIRTLVGRCDRHYDKVRTKVELYGGQFVTGSDETKAPQETVDQAPPQDPSPKI